MLTDDLNVIAQPAGLQGLKRKLIASTKNDFVAKVGGTYAMHLTRTVLSLLFAVLVARLLGPEGRGLFAAATVIGALGVQFGNLGLQTSNIHFAAKNRKDLPALIGNTALVSFGAGLAILAFLAGAQALRPGWLGLSGMLAAMSYVWVPFGILYLLLQSLLLGIQDFRHYNYIELVNRALPLAGIGGLYLVHSVSAGTLFAATFVALIVACVWALLALRADRSNGPPRVDLHLLRANSAYGIKAYLTSIFCFLVLRIDLLMVQKLLGSEQAGYYSVSTSIADNLAAIAVVIGSILLPKLSEMSDIRQKLTLTKKAVLISAAILVPLLTIGGLFARPAVHILFGSRFEPAVVALVLLLPGMFFVGLNGVAVQFLNSIGYPVSIVIVWAIATFLNIGLNLVAIPRYGIAGASVVSSVCYFFVFVANSYIILRKHQNVRAATADV
ncbi:MAG: polysaccharide biosynthesis protein [Acidobacteriaceae bacterium]|nr:polysaccharide biosynthesis protein [Acidobacteriaceae bacterium]